jgi:molecular chaperone DnaK
MITQAVGIDLGTTYSAVAVVNKDGVPEILPNAEGDHITPSVVLFDGDEIIIGSYAKQAALAFPHQVVEYVKRHVGEDDYSFVYKSQSYSPEQLSSFLLAKLKHDAELHLGHPVTEAVITVPAYFGDRQRRATIRAGELAGLKVLKLLNEPTAAAFAYGLANRGVAAKCLVFDLGGGTFDVTLVDLDRDDISVIATNGDHQLGGKDWDDALIGYAAEQFVEKHGINPLDDLTAYQDLKQKCINAKIALSRRPKVNLFYDYQGRILRLTLTREDFEDLAEGLLARVDALVRDVLDDARVQAHEVDTVLLAGGSTRMPMVRELIRDIFGKDPATDINPDECVALGAALTAALESAKLRGEEPPVHIRTHDVSSHSLGMVAMQDGELINAVVIPRNSRIPCEHLRDDFITHANGQASLDLWLIQGQNPDPEECNVLGHFEFMGIPPRAAGESRVGVTYRYSANGIVEVEAMDLDSGQTLAHRAAAPGITIKDVKKGRVPMHIAVVVDCSGSMYGSNMANTRTALKDFLRKVVRPHRCATLIAAPGGLKSRPTHDVDELDTAIEGLIPVGDSPLHEGLMAARKALRGDAGIQRVCILITDGQTKNPEATEAECRRIRRRGGRLITVGVGKRVREGYLRRLSTTPEDYHHVRDDLELEGTFHNLVSIVAN